MEKSIGIIIPARIGSSRYPQKPLAKLNGMPLIWHVWSGSKKSKFIKDDDIFIATDSKKIENVCSSFGAKTIIIDDECLTGTDRVAKANKILKYDFVINVQGDEPLVSSDDIDIIANKILKTSSNNILYNGMKRLSDESEFRSLNVPKVVFNNQNKLMYISRSPIPISKANEFEAGYKQVCIYGFSKESLKVFIEYKHKSKFEKIEDIEILRFLEMGFNIEMVEFNNDYIAVDTKEDLIKVQKYLDGKF